MKKNKLPHPLIGHFIIYEKVIGLHIAFTPLLVFKI